MLINLDIKLRNEVGVPVGNTATLLAGAFMRLRISEEQSVLKVQEFILDLTHSKKLDLDQKDFDFFKLCLVSCDAYQMVKMSALNVLYEVSFEKLKRKK